VAELGTEETPNSSAFAKWGRDMKSLALQIDSLAADAAAAESVAERLASEVQEKEVSC
jgi:hypothetical protein